MVTDEAHLPASQEHVFPHRVIVAVPHAWWSFHYMQKVVAVFLWQDSDIALPGTRKMVSNLTCSIIGARFDHPLISTVGFISFNMSNLFPTIRTWWSSCCPIISLGCNLFPSIFHSYYYSSCYFLIVCSCSGKHKCVEGRSRTAIVLECIHIYSGSIESSHVVELQ